MRIEFLEVIPQFLYFREEVPFFGLGGVFGAIVQKPVKVNRAPPVFAVPPGPAGEIARENTGYFPAKAFEPDVLGDVLPGFAENRHVFGTGVLEPFVE